MSSLTMSSLSLSRNLSEENPIPRPNKTRTSVRDRRVALGDITDDSTNSSSFYSTLVHYSKKAPKLSRNWNLGILDCVLPNTESNVIVPDEDTELPQIDDNLLASSPASPTQSEMVVRRAVRSKRLVFDPEIQDMVSRQAHSVDVERMKRMFENVVEENTRNIEAYVTGLRELIAKLQYQKHLLIYQVLELEENEKCLHRRLLQEDMDDGLEFHIQLV